LNKKKFDRSSLFFKHGKSKIENNMNVININILYEELALLKDVLFDTNKRIIFDYLIKNNVLSLDEIQYQDFYAEFIKSLKNVEDKNDDISLNLKKIFDSRKIYLN